MDRETTELLHALCEAALESRIAADQQQRLEQLVLSSDEARRYYVEYVHQHASLQWSAADPTAISGIDQQAAELGVSRMLAAESDIVPYNTDARSDNATLPAPGRRRWQLWAVVTAATAAGVAVWAIRHAGPGPDLDTAPPVAVHESAEPLDYTVAVLVQAAAVQWESMETPPRTGAPLAPGWLRLKSGVAQIEFYSGATVVLEGPAEFQLISRMEGFCKRGKLRASVPSHAHGFSIGTPKMELVDLGTEFGIQVEEGQQTEVHVFEGKVELYDAGSNRAANSRKELTTGQGLRLNEPGTASPVTSDPKAFLSARDLSAQTEAQTRRRHQQWQSASQQWRQDEGLLAYYNFQPADAWTRTLPDLAGRQPQPHDGSIVGCAWGAGRWPGKQGLEFKQVSDRVLLNIPGEHDSLTLAAWVCLEGLPNRNNSLLMSDAWEPGGLHWQIGKNGTLILGVQTNPKKGVHYHAAEVLTADHFGRWLHLAVVYDRDRKLVTQYIDGRPMSVEPILHDIPLRIHSAEIGNWNMASHRNSTPIRFLTGCMDELMIFSRALSEQQLEDLYIQGQPLL